jgi:16S rRNA (guanine966-N2)-methyltransferase
LRIIAGIYKGRKLEVKLPKKDTRKQKGELGYRPTTDFLREALFNIIGDDIKDKDFLDVFAGSGAVGIEALSRGARSVTFIESDFENIRVIKKNLAQLNAQGDVIKSDAVGFLKRAPYSYDIIFIDPPYFKNLENPCIKEALSSGVLKKDGIIILQHHIRVDLETEPYEKRRYKPNALSFYKE